MPPQVYRENVKLSTDFCAIVQPKYIVSYHFRLVVGFTQSREFLQWNIMYKLLFTLSSPSQLLGPLPLGTGSVAWLQFPSLPPSPTHNSGWWIGIHCTFGLSFWKHAAVRFKMVVWCIIFIVTSLCAVLYNKQVLSDIHSTLNSNKMAAEHLFYFCVQFLNSEATFLHYKRSNK